MKIILRALLALALSFSSMEITDADPSFKPWEPIAPPSDFYGAAYRLLDPPEFGCYANPWKNRSGITLLALFVNPSIDPEKRRVALQEVTIFLSEKGAGIIEKKFFVQRWVRPNRLEIWEPLDEWVPGTFEEIPQYVDPPDLWKELCLKSANFLPSETKKLFFGQYNIS